MTTVMKFKNGQIQAMTQFGLLVKVRVQLQSFQDLSRAALGSGSFLVDFAEV